MNQSATEADASQVGPVSTVDDKPTGYQRGSTRSWIAVAGGLIGAQKRVAGLPLLIQQPR